MDELTTVEEAAEPLPVEQRIEGLLDEPEAPEAAAEAEGGHRRDERGRFAKEESDEPEAEAEGTDDTAPEEASGESTQEEAEAETSIEPPLSWNAEAKELFKQLPPDLQTIVSQRESERERSVNQRFNEIASEKKAVEQERQQYASQLQALIPALQQQIAGEFADIKTAADLERLASDDPARFTRWQAKQAALQAAQGHQWQLAEQQNAEREAKLKEWTVEQEKILFDRVPAWKKDVAAGQKEIGQIKDYLVNQGIDAEQAKDLRDAGLILIARKARLYDEAQKAKATAKPVTPSAPKVVKPGAPQAQTPNEDRIAAHRKELKRTGRTEAAAKLLEQFM